MYHRTALCIAALLIAGCTTTSAPQRYFALDMRPAAERNLDFNLIVQHIRVADPLVGKQIVIRKSPTEIEYYAVGQWASQLDEMLTEKLEAEFGPRNPANPSVILSGRLLAFEQVDLPNAAAQAHVKLALSMRDSKTGRSTAALAEKTYEVYLPAETVNPEGIAMVLSHAVEKLAGQIVQDASAL